MIPKPSTSAPTSSPVNNTGDLNSGNQATNSGNQVSGNQVSPGAQDAGFAGSVWQEYPKTIYDKKVSVDETTSKIGEAPFSLANDYALFTWQGLHGSNSMDLMNYYRDSKKNTLVSPSVSREPSVSQIIEYFSENYGGMDYSYSDFLYAKHFRKIPNNHMITLRRFANPCEDNIYDLSKKYIKKDSNGNPIKSGDDFQTGIANMVQPDISRAVTWMTEDMDNRMEDIMNFTFGYAWREQEGKTNTYQSKDGGYTAQPFYSRFGSLGKAFLDTIKGVNSEEKFKRARYAGFDMMAETYPNFVFGPVNVINKMMTRDQGLNFDHQIKLKFVYELKSYDGVNPKVAMLDILSNLLVLTYNNANFFGGAHRFYGAEGYVASQFGNPDKLANGDFSGYIKDIANDLGSGFSDLFAGKGGDFSLDSILEGAGNVAGNYLGNVLGSFMNDQVGAVPGILATQALLTGEATGNWHMTVGNPMNPIAMFGNLIMETSNISFKNGLGRDDFPNELHLEVTLKDARPRDKGDIESAFNAGKGRIYASSTKLGDVLNHQGKDVKVYGAIQKDENGKEQISSNANNANQSLDDAEVSKPINTKATSQVSQDFLDTLDLHVNFG